MVPDYKELVEKIKNLELENAELKNNLQTTEEILDNIALGSGIGWWEWDSTTNKITFSDLKPKILGYKPEDLASNYDDFIKVLHPEDRQSVIDAMNDHLSGKVDTYEVNYRIKAKDGNWKWFHDKGKVISRTEDGKPLKFVGIGFDTTLQKDKEEKRIASELNYQALFKENHSVMLLIDTDTGEIIDCNDAACKFYGYTPEELCSLNISDINTLSLEEVTHEMKLAIKEERRHFYFRHRLKNGDVLPVEVYSGKIIQRGKTLLYSIVRDISDRIKAEEEILRREQKLKEVLENSIDAAYKRNLNDNSYEYLSPVFEHISGYSPEEFTSMALDKVLELMHPDDLAEVNSIVGIALSNSSRSTYQINYRLKDKSGQYRWLLDQFRVIRNFQDSPIALIGSVSDITERKFIEEELKESEEKYRSIFENLQDVYYEANLDSRIIEVSPSIFNISKGQYTRDELIGKYLNDFYADINERNVFYTEIMKNGFVTDYKVNLKNKDGSVIACSINSKLHFDKNNKPLKIIGIMRDITERMKAESKIIESEERFRNIFAISPDAIAITDIETGIYADVNSAFEKLSGYERDEIIGKSSVNLGFWMDDNDRESFISNLQINGFVDNHEISFAIKDGSLINTLVSSRIIYLSGKSYLLNVIKDITDRIINENELKKLVSIIDSSNDSIVGMDLNGIIKSWNNAANMLYGYKADEVIGKPYSILLTENNKDEFINAINKLLNDEIPKNFESIRITKDGILKNVSTTISPIYEPNGNLIGISSIARDITDKILIQNELKESEQNLRELNVTKDKFFSIIAHDLRSPIAAFKQMTELISDEYTSLSDDDLRKILIELKKSSNSVFELLDNLLTWSRSQRGKIPFAPENNYFKHVVNSCFNVLRAHAGNKQITLIDKVPIDANAYFDLPLINIVLTNLVSNAVKFTPEGGYIIVSSGINNDNPDYLLISVTDSGIGMNSSKISRLFKLDDNVSTLGTNKEKGTGLGLILCKEFVEKNGGTLSVESEVGKGSVINFTLPIKNK